jgi:rubrerythrin
MILDDFKEKKIMTSQVELLKFLEKQIKIEKEIVRSLNQGLLEIQNPAVKSVLRGISLDSVKHAQMYSSAMKLLTRVSKALTQENLDKQTDLVEKHIRLESQLIEKINSKILNIKNDKVKLLLNAILSDEKKHHVLLKKILEILVQGETITDEDWFNVLWKSALFHGSPGG